MRGSLLASSFVRAAAPPLRDLARGAIRAVGAAALVAGAVGAAPAGGEPAAVTPGAAQRLDAALQSVAAKTPGLSVAVAENGRIVYARGFGFADVGAKEPVTPETRFHIASITKMFTAVSVMQLVEGGRVRLDDPLARFLPDAPHASEITIRELLTHTSGLWNYADEAFAANRTATATTPQAIVASAAAHPLTGKPGAAFAYSNTGYVLLGLVVEAVTHEPLARYEAEHIFGPAGMTSTTNGVPPGVAVARGYQSAGGPASTPFDSSWAYADGDIVSTAGDLARFDVALMSGKLVSPATFAQMRSPTVDASGIGPGVRYGLGIMTVTSGGVTFVGHHGGVPGFEAENEMLPERGFAVVVLSNAFDFPTALANRAVLSVLAPQIVARAVADARAAAAAAPPAVEDPAISAKLRAFFAALQRGEIDRAAVTDEVNAALSDAALQQVKAQMASLGAIDTLTFVGRQAAGGMTAYRYRATFSSGKTLPITFALDANGKIASFVFA